MVAICLYFQLHQPFRLKRYRVFDMGQERSYFDEPVNQSIMHRMSSQVYLPVNQQLQRLLERSDHLEVTFSLSGTAIEQMVRYAPALLRSFQRLAQTGKVTFTAETYYHSFSGFYSLEEFERQVVLHQNLIKKYFGMTPTVFKNTHYALTKDQTAVLARLGFRAIVYDNKDSHVSPVRCNGMVCIPIHQYLSSYFSGEQQDASHAAQTFAREVAGVPEQSVHLHAAYQWFAKNTEHMKLLESMVAAIDEYRLVSFSSATSLADQLAEEIVEGEPPSTPRIFADMHPWLNNEMQQQALRRLYELEPYIKETGEQRLLDTWARLTASDHLFYMCTDDWTEESPYRHASCYESPYEGFLYFMNVLGDLERQCGISGSKQEQGRTSPHHASAV